MDTAGDFANSEQLKFAVLERNEVRDLKLVDISFHFTEKVSILASTLKRSRPYYLRSSHYTVTHMRYKNSYI